MIRTVTATLAAALVAVPLAAGAAPAKSAKPAAPTSAKAAAPAKPAPAKPAAPEPVFDSRDPQSLVALLGTAGAKATVGAREDDSVLVSVTSNAAVFSAQFAGCNAQGKACKVVLFDNLADQPAPSFAQMNAFNQSSAMCRGYEDKTGRPHVVYSTLLLADDSRERMRLQVAAWTGCIGDFRNFLKDPNGYLASAP